MEPVSLLADVYSAVSRIGDRWLESNVAISMPSGTGLGNRLPFGCATRLRTSILLFCASPFVPTKKWLEWPESLETPQEAENNWAFGRRDRPKKLSSMAKHRPYPETPSIRDFRRFVAICGVIDAAAARREELSLNKVDQQLLHEGWDFKKSTLGNCLSAMERFWRVESGGLVLRDGAAQLTEEGKRLRDFCVELLDLVDSRERQVKAARLNSVRVSTHNVYELVLIHEVLPPFVKSFSDAGVLADVQIQEIVSVQQGLDQLRNGTASLLLDAVATKPEDEVVESDDLNIEWERVFLIPRHPEGAFAAAIAKLPTREWLTLSDLKQCPICFVESADIARAELSVGAMAPRVGLGTLESVWRLTATGQYIGMSINWTRAFGEGWEDQFDVRFVALQRPKLHLWLCKSAELNATSPAGIFASHIRKFFETESRAKDHKGNKRILLPSTPEPRH